MTRNQLYLQVSHPDLQTDHYDTALGNLTYKSDISYACHYLYDEDRLQFRGYVNLTRTIQEVSESVSDAEATSEVERNIREAVRDGPFETVIFPTHISEVPDDKERPNLVVMGADRAEVRGPDPAAPAFIEEIFAETAVDYDGPRPHGTGVHRGDLRGDRGGLRRPHRQAGVQEQPRVPGAKRR
jgi:hypothetical protein